MTTYVFDPAWTAEHDRLQALESLFDADSMHHILGVGLEPGWNCLEVGCGAGGIARRLAEHVGESGRVVALDLDTRFVDGRGLENLEVRCQDLMTQPLEQGIFDLAHARVVLEYISDQRSALERIVSTLRPGGWAVVEGADFAGAMGAALARYVCPGEHGALYRRIYRAIEAIFTGSGADPCFGTRLISEMKAAGLEDVGGALHTPLVAGGTETWVRGSVEYMRARLPATGLVTPDDVEHFLTITADRSTSYVPAMMLTAWGRRPAV